MSRRHWYTGAVLMATSVSRTFSALRNHRLGRFVPFLGLLLIGTVVLWFINTIAPLAPFVYSLF